MVQAAAPTSSSYCFANCSPCQAISDIVQRIADFAASLFRAIAQFFAAGFPSPAPAPLATPMESAALINTSVSSPAPASQPEVFVEPAALDNPFQAPPTLSAVVSEDVVLDPHEQGMAFLRAQLAHHAKSTIINNIAFNMGRPSLARKFLARLLIENLMMGRSPYAGPYPEFLTHPQPPCTLAILETARLVQKDFNASTNPQERAYIRDCLWQGVRDEVRGPGSTANRANALVKSLLNDNAPFIACADELRLERLRNMSEKELALIEVEEGLSVSEEDVGSTSE